ncbi:hypothetical protein V5O48_018016 [Marasmius crinis-equi]|uniref:Uncharacterized protein n=1 Tax=Marasmius crinis-equi TaxID=585013 RepID=A0ABR3EME6_9AGAR
MSELSIRLIGASSLAGSVIFQVVGLSSEYVSLHHYLPSPFPYCVHPYFVYGAFILQTVLHIWWLLKPSTKIRLEDSGMDREIDIEGVSEMESIDHQAIPAAELGLLTFVDRGSYLPIYILAQQCVLIWTVAFHYNHYIPALAILACSACVQFYSLFLTHSELLTKGKLTMTVAKLNAAYTVMLISKTWAVMDQDVPSPPTVQLVNHGFVFVLLAVASGPDPTFGLALVYVLAALYHGSYFNMLWHNTFYWTAAVISAITAIDYAIRSARVSEEGQEEEGESDLESTTVLFARNPKETFKIPEYYAGTMELPLPLAMEECNEGFCAEKQGMECSRLPRFMQDAQKKPEPLVSPDYFSYAFL